MTVQASTIDILSLKYSRLSIFLFIPFSQCNNPSRTNQRCRMAVSDRISPETINEKDCTRRCDEGDLSGVSETSMTDKVLIPTPNPTPNAPRSVDNS